MSKRLAILLTLIISLMSFAFTTAQATQKTTSCRYVKQYNARHKKSYLIKKCSEHVGIKQQVKKTLASLTPAKNSALQKKISVEKQAFKLSHYQIVYFEPSYVLPFYYTGTPAHSVYTDPAGRALTSGQTLMHSEFKAQFSFLLPLWPNINGSHYSLNAYYTQLMYWQVYAKSQYFRDTNYEPSVFISDNFLRNWQLSVGAVHQSNGRGGTMERSWNRAYADLSFSGVHWVISLKPWFLIFQKESSDLHNPDIAKYLGYGRIVIAYKIGHDELSLMERNGIVSGFKRGGYELDYTFPITRYVTGMAQVFTGYGQSMLEYKHRTTSAGVGLSFSNWM